MLQNKKVAPISGGSKPFVCVKRSGEKVTEWLECNFLRYAQERTDDRQKSVDEWRCLGCPPVGAKASRSLVR
jgi:hypothetical protein